MTQLCFVNLFLHFLSTEQLAILWTRNEIDTRFRLHHKSFLSLKLKTVSRVDSWSVLRFKPSHSRIFFESTIAGRGDFLVAGLPFGIGTPKSVESAFSASYMSCRVHGAVQAIHQYPKLKCLYVCLGSITHIYKSTGMASGELI